MDSEPILNEQQLAWMVNHQIAIALAYDEVHRDRGDGDLHRLFESSAYREIFGKMDWDDAYDRYQCSDAYDETLPRLLSIRLTLELGRAWNNPGLQEDIQCYAPDAAGAVSLAATLAGIDMYLEKRLAGNR